MSIIKSFQNFSKAYSSFSNSQLIEFNANNRLLMHSPYALLSVSGTAINSGIYANGFAEYENVLNFLAKKEKQGITISNDLVTIQLTSGKATLKEKLEKSQPQSLDLSSLEHLMENTVGAATLLSSILDCKRYYQTKANRFGLDSIRFDFNNGFAVSTDQVTLRAHKLPILPELNFTLTKNQVSILEPILKAYKSSDIEVQVKESKTILFKLKDSEDIVLYFKQPEVQFPNYMGAIEMYSDESFGSLSPEALKSFLDDLSILPTNNILLKADSETITGSLRNGSSIVESTLNWINPAFQAQSEVGASHYYLTKYLKGLEKDEGNIKLLISDCKSPLVLEDVKGFYFMSPINPNNC